MKRVRCARGKGGTVSLGIKPESNIIIGTIMPTWCPERKQKEGMNERMNERQNKQTNKQTIKQIKEKKIHTTLEFFK